MRLEDREAAAGAPGASRIEWYEPLLYPNYIGGYRESDSKSITCITEPTRGRSRYMDGNCRRCQHAEDAKDFTS